MTMSNRDDAQFQALSCTALAAVTGGNDIPLPIPWDPSFGGTHPPGGDATDRVRANIPKKPKLMEVEIKKPQPGPPPPEGLGFPLLPVETVSPFPLFPL